jgi:hypothetical protein
LSKGKSGKISTINVGLYKNAESKPVSSVNLIEEKEMKIQDSKESKEDETEEYEDPFRQPILSQINLTPLPETYDG